MEKTNLLTLVVTLTVGIILAGSLLMPVISDATETERTFTNGGLYYLTNPDEALSVKYVGDGTWEMDGEALSYTSSGNTNIIVTNDTFIRNSGQVRGANVANWTDADLTISNGSITGTATVSGNTTSVNIAYEWIVVATNEKSEYVMKANTATSYIKADSTIIADGVSIIKNSANTNVYIDIFIDVENLEATVTTTKEGVTFSDVSVNATPIEGFVDLYAFTSITFKATYEGVTTPLTYNIVIVPSSVTAELTQHLDAGEIALINVLPVIVIIGLVIAAVGAIFVRNRD